MATIVTTTRRIIVKESANEIFTQIGHRWGTFTEILYGEKMNGDRVTHESLIHINRDFIIEIYD